MAPVTKELNSEYLQGQGYLNVTILNKGKIKNLVTRFYSASPNFLEVTNNDSLNPGESQTRTSLSDIRYLYTGD